jgi:hypothetical protein
VCASGALAAEIYASFTKRWRILHFPIRLRSPVINDKLAESINSRQTHGACRTAWVVSRTLGGDGVWPGLTVQAGALFQTKPMANSRLARILNGSKTIESRSAPLFHIESISNNAGLNSFAGNSFAARVSVAGAGFEPTTFGL